MNYFELYKLIEGLDRNKDGEINYRYVASVVAVNPCLLQSLDVRFTCTV